MTTEEIISLGKQIAEQLDTTDTLGRWMAHYIAGLIAVAEADPDKPEVQRDCAQAILQLWVHRAAFPGVNPPLASFEPVMRALERLDPERVRWGYFEAHRTRVGPESSPNTAALELALQLDKSIGGVIRFLVQEATADAAITEQKWLHHKEDGAVPETSIVSSIIQAMGYDGSDNEKKADALQSVDAVRAALDKLADSLRRDTNL